MSLRRAGKIPQIFTGFSETNDKTDRPWHAKFSVGRKETFENSCLSMLAIRVYIDLPQAKIVELSNGNCKLFAWQYSSSYDVKGRREVRHLHEDIVWAPPWIFFLFVTDELFYDIFIRILLSRMQ